MIGLIILIVVAVWAALGYVLWKVFVHRFVRSLWLKIPLTILLAAIWFVGPVLDEILGAREFDRLCAEIPAVKFHGPVAIGPGVLFNEQGNPRWKNADEFSAIKRNTKVFEQLFDQRQERTKLTVWPIPIFEARSTYFARATGQPVVESFHRGSAGGWIKRATGWGSHAPYQCHAKGNFPRDEQLIAFKGM
jgi:hypothetical protein